MAAFHPFFVHFPIALLVAASLFDWYALLRRRANHHITAFVLQGGAGLMAIASGFSGNLAEQGILADPDLDPALLSNFQAHTSWGNAMVWVILLGLAIRIIGTLEKKNWVSSGWLMPVLSTLIAVCILYTGFLGGELVDEILATFRS